jgi:hypothetical protein
MIILYINYKTPASFIDVFILPSKGTSFIEVAFSICRELIECGCLSLKNLCNKPMCNGTAKQLMKQKITLQNRQFSSVQ